MADSIKYSYKEHWIALQYKAEKEFIDEFLNGEYTLEHPLVKYNPYLINPLAAVVLFRTEKEVAITLTVKGKTKEADFYHTFPKAKEHILPIVGLYSDYENKVEIRPYRGTPVTITIKTPDVFNGTKMIDSMDTTAAYLQDNVIIESPAGEEFTTGFDYAGDARFHLNIPCVFDLKRLKNGHLLLGTDRLIDMPYYMSGLYEMDAVGKIYREYRLPGGYHHDMIELPNGDLLVLTDDFSTDTVEDKLALVDRKSGEILRVYDYKDFVTPGVGKSGSWSDHDWFHNNSVWYDENTNSITLSARHMDAMFNIDFCTGELNWIIGDPEGWPKDMVEKYFFTPVGDNFEWQYEQHANLITPNGDVMCFDNHHYGSKNKDTYAKAEDSYSRGVRYRINTETRTIEQVWQYGKERGAEFFSPYICNVEYYNEGHYMISSGGIAYDENGKPSELLGAFAKFQGGSLKTITVEVCNGKKELEMVCPGNYYRAEKLKLYHNGSNLDMGRGEILGEMGITREFDTEIPAPFDGELIPAVYEPEIVEEMDRFTFNAKFEKGQLVMLMLEQGDEIHRYFISTTAVPYLAMCVGTFLDSDERSTRTMINKRGLSGEYKVRVIIDDKKYETGITINI